jgi:EAL domain-containing protein (putative c-di-GMP-specific phosphodiesterase class I)
VETVARRDRLLELGCDIGQRYLWSQQVEADALPEVARAMGIDGSTLSTA